MATEAATALDSEGAPLVGGAAESVEGGPGKAGLGGLPSEGVAGWMSSTGLFY